MRTRLLVPRNVSTKVYIIDVVGFICRERTADIKYSRFFSDKSILSYIISTVSLSS